ncbi:MAG TPA: hypothetical protein VMS60_07155 [Solirubrobacterales bacterium]|nr:hypothetical protein [Solirubrobacterales bacterium]
MDKQKPPINARPKGSNPLEQVTWLWQRWVVWPLQDRRDLPGGPSRAVVGWGATLLVAAAGAGALSLSGATGSGESAPTAILVSGDPAVERTLAPPPPEPTEPTLQGATPVFKAESDKDSSKVDAAKALESSSPPAAESTGSAATDTISSELSPSPTDSAAASAVIDGPPAGPKAVAVAEAFADAFVVYETGGEKSEVRKAFAATATPELSRSLLRRPPRLPAEVEVPEAKVVNVVAGPSHGGVFTISVSLLRVGATSELRLDMENLKDGGWRVTNVLG